MFIRTYKITNWVRFVNKEVEMKWYVGKDKRRQVERDFNYTERKEKR